MPAPRADVDRHAVEAHVRSYGVRAAAEAFGLPLATIGDWSRQGGWCKVQTPTFPNSMKGKSVSPNGPNKAGKAAQNSLEKLGNGAKTHLAKYVANTAKHAASLNGEEALAAAPSVVSVAKVGQSINLPGFEREQSGSGTFLGLHVTVRAGEGQVLDVPVEVEQLPDGEA